MNSGKILIVEDEPDLRNVYSLILQHNGFEVCTASNGQEALEEVDSCNPQLVLLDIFMPVLDGKGFLEQLDAKKFENMKIVVCSNTSDQTLLDDMIKLGADKVITKSDLAPADLTLLVTPYMV